MLLLEMEVTHRRNKMKRISERKVQFVIHERPGEKKLLYFGFRYIRRVACVFIVQKCLRYEQKTNLTFGRYNTNDQSCF